MADRLNGYRILILETREEAQFSRLLTEQGADVLQCPMFTIHDAPDPAPVEAWIGRCHRKAAGRPGADDRRRPAPADEGGAAHRRRSRHSSPRSARRANSRAGPNPGKALREIGLEPQMTTEKPTSEGIAEMLSRLDLSGHRLGLQLYPDKDHSVADRRDQGARRRGRYRAALCL